MSLSKAFEFHCVLNTHYNILIKGLRLRYEKTLIMLTNLAIKNVTVFDEISLPHPLSFRTRYVLNNLINPLGKTLARDVRYHATAQPAASLPPCPFPTSTLTLHLCIFGLWPLVLEF